VLRLSKNMNNCRLLSALIGIATLAAACQTDVRDPLLLTVSNTPPSFTPQQTATEAEIFPAATNDPLADCLASETTDDPQLIGLWFRWKGNEFEKYYFRDDGSVSIWLGGRTEDGLNIEPFIRHGTYSKLNENELAVNIENWPLIELRYGLCGNGLRLIDLTKSNAKIITFVRIPDFCWEHPDDQDPQQCYP
jgi:hypothetical protein